MHVVLTILYGVTVWLSLIAYALITGVSITAIVIGGPVVISGSIATILTLDYLFSKLSKIIVRR